MLRRLALAALLALTTSLAAAQFATIGPTPATSDNGDRLATTAWVNNFPVTKINGVDQTTAWTSYTPTVTAGAGTITTVSATGRSKTIGKTVHVQIEVTITNAGSGTNQLIVTLPFTAAPNKYVGTAFESALTGRSGAAVTFTTTQIYCRYADASTVIGTGNVIDIGITYELP